MVFLSTNYRCHKDIVKIPNQLFYKNEIKSFPQYAHPHPDTKFPLLFVCSSLGPTTDSNLEAQLILQQVEKFVHSWPSDWGRRDLTKIGLVTASRTQVCLYIVYNIYISYSKIVLTACYHKKTSTTRISRIKVYSYAHNLWNSR